VEAITCVTIGSLAEPVPSDMNQSPLTGLSSKGVEETHELGRELKLFEAPAIDHVFVAAPYYMLPAVAEMAILLTGATGTGYAELPLTVFPLTEKEAEQIRHILTLEPGSPLQQVPQDPEHNDLLRHYARHRHDRILISMAQEKAKHGILFGLSWLVQAIGATFAREGEERRRIENIVPTNGHAFQIDVRLRVLKVPCEEKLGKLAQYP